MTYGLVCCRITRVGIGHADNPGGLCLCKTDDDCCLRAADCICTMSSVNSASIDPPHEVVNKNCPIHGNAAARDPDAAYEASRDDPPEPFWMEDDS